MNFIYRGNYTPWCKSTFKECITMSCKQCFGNWLNEEVEDNIIEETNI